jgi:hypothetical protein
MHRARAEAISVVETSSLRTGCSPEIVIGQASMPGTGLLAGALGNAPDSGRVVFQEN